MKESVRERYARHAVDLPETETPPTLGLGDPVEIAQLRSGETVLDLGSGPGRDLIAAAKAVGSSGRAIGVDFTPEMIERALRSAADAGLHNVSIIEGDLEKLPVPCGAVDVVISNCVINLVDDKRRALTEALRVLRPGGRLAILDTAFETEPPAELRNNPDAWCGCVGGSLVRSDYEAILRDIGYEDVEVRRLDTSCSEACSVEDISTLSVAVTARKPASSHPGTDLRPAVSSDVDRINTLLQAEHLPADGLGMADTLVAVDGSDVLGAISLERHGTVAIARSLVVDPAHRRQGIGFRLVAGALEVARWSGAETVRLLADRQDPYFDRFGFKAGSLDFESSDLPMLGRPSRKELPTVSDCACC
ncbi:MAG TPA: GNAT family N-acetyltransferase [Actinomycetota bacterium]|jgi:SAM-dependent methyltransferase/N-acetylglutamate synthase-like GNAT family acetyltransferase|nr:GNAT family N-acetyltransferase [Actinomycetota bacterium]